MTHGQDLAGIKRAEFVLVTKHYIPDILDIGGLDLHRLHKLDWSQRVSLLHLLNDPATRSMNGPRGTNGPKIKADSRSTQFLRAKQALRKLGVIGMNDLLSQIVRGLLKQKELTPEQFVEQIFFHFGLVKKKGTRLKEELTEKERRFILNLIGGDKPKDAAQKVGWSPTTAPSALQTINASLRVMQKYSYRHYDLLVAIAWHLAERD
jgi:hypothetical protein